MHGTTSSQAVRPPRRFWRSLWIFAGVIALAIGGTNYWWGHVHHRLEEISPGALWKSGAMSAAELVATCQRLGIKTVVDLRTTGSDDSEQPERADEVEAEARAMAAAGIKHAHVPSEQVPDAATVNRYLAVVGERAQGPFLVHCHHGTGRAELFSALYHIEFDGWDNDRARRATRLIPFWNSFSPTKPKGKYLLEYRKRSPAIPVQSARTAGKP